MLLAGEICGSDLLEPPAPHLIWKSLFANVSHVTALDMESKNVLLETEQEEGFGDRRNTSSLYCCRRLRRETMLSCDIKLWGQELAWSAVGKEEPAVGESAGGSHR